MAPADLHVICMLTPGAWAKVYVINKQLIPTGGLAYNNKSNHVYISMLLSDW